MKKKILIGSIFAVMLMLSMPFVSSIQTRQKTLNVNTENNGNGILKELFCKLLWNRIGRLQQKQEINFKITLWVTGVLGNMKIVLLSLMLFLIVMPALMHMYASLHLRSSNLIDLYHNAECGLCSQG